MLLDGAALLLGGGLEPNVSTSLINCPLWVESGHEAECRFIGYSANLVGTVVY